MNNGRLSISQKVAWVCRDLSYSLKRYEGTLPLSKICHDIQKSAEDHLDFLCRKMEKGHKKGKMKYAKVIRKHRIISKRIIQESVMIFLQGYKVTRLQGYKVTRLQGYKVTREIN